ncbi:MAG: CCA tRNA nucleotidyltransferase [Clostridia bacterium]|nr:CCA tRNA nucleotidyltransferase [Clostridia bacterium]
MNYSSQAELAIEILEAGGFEAYIVGGCLRNILLGKEPNDWDMTTSALPEQTRDIFISAGYKVIETGLKHGTVTVIIDSIPIEITTFRIDGEYSDSRHPDSVAFTRNLKEDLSRRDFTVNAMAYSKKSGLVDLFCGKKDLDNMILRCVGVPTLRFSEDALRILRAFRFSSEYGFTIEQKTKEAIKECSKGLLRISRERIYHELCRMLMGDHASYAASELVSCEVLPFIFEEYKDSYMPPCDILNKLPKILAVRLAAFIVNFKKSDAEKALISLKMSNKDKSEVKLLLSAISTLKDQNENIDVIFARRFIQKYGSLTESAISLAELLRVNVIKIKETVSNAKKDRFPLGIPDLAINGNDVIKLGATGEGVGEILSLLLSDATKDPSVNTRKQLLALAQKYILEKKQ